MKNGLSFSLLAATVFAGLVLSLVDASTPREAPAATAADVTAVSATATVEAQAPTPATPGGALALSER